MISCFFWPLLLLGVGLYIIGHFFFEILHNILSVIMETPVAFKGEVNFSDWCNYDLPPYRQIRYRSVIAPEGSFGYLSGSG